jgi:hypothetical protein
MATKRGNSKLLDWSIYLHELEARLRHASEHSDEASAGAENGAGSMEKPCEVLDGVNEIGLKVLAERLCHPDHQVRLEAAHKISEIDDPQVTEALVRLLQDENHSVRWAAMSGLINQEREAIKPLLEALTRDFNSSTLRQGAHHVLRALHDQGNLTDVETKVFRALEGVAPGVQAAWAANNALIEEA